MPALLGTHIHICMARCSSAVVAIPDSSEVQNAVTLASNCSMQPDIWHEGGGSCLFGVEASQPNQGHNGAGLDVVCLS